MLDKFFIWVGRNRREIGYTIGGINLLLGINYALQGLYGLAVLWLVIGSFLIWDAHE